MIWRLPSVGRRGFESPASSFDFEEGAAAADPSLPERLADQRDCSEDASPFACRHESPRK